MRTTWIQFGARPLPSFSNIMWHQLHWLLLLTTLCFTSGAQAVRVEQHSGFSPNFFSRRPERNSAQGEPGIVPRSTPWVLIDPSTGRNVQGSGSSRPLAPSRDSNPGSLFGLPSEALSGQENTARIQRHHIRGSEYFSDNGTPVYKMKKKYPLGYGR